MGADSLSGSLIVGTRSFGLWVLQSGLKASKGWDSPSSPPEPVLDCGTGSRAPASPPQHFCSQRPGASASSVAFHQKSARFCPLVLSRDLLFLFFVYAFVFSRPLELLSCSTIVVNGEGPGIIRLLYFWEGKNPLSIRTFGLVPRYHFDYSEVRTKLYIWAAFAKRFAAALQWRRPCGVRGFRCGECSGAISGCSQEEGAGSWDWLGWDIIPQEPRLLPV
jgi:hypothetical protein